MKTLTICGSMRFADEMQEIAYALEVHKGYNILQCVYCADDQDPSDIEITRLSNSHYQKIDMSDGIYVVNIGGYIGTSVKKEIEYAKQRGKEVIYHCAIDKEVNYEQEISSIFLRQWCNCKGCRYAG